MEMWGELLGSINEVTWGERFGSVNRNMGANVLMA